MNNRYRITPLRGGINYQTSYRKTLDGARKVAKARLADDFLTPSRVVIEERSDELVYPPWGSRPVIKWQQIEEVTRAPTKTIFIKVTKDRDALTRCWNEDYANKHAGNVYEVMRFDSDGWAICVSAKFHPQCFERLEPDEASYVLSVTKLRTEQ